MAFPTTTAPTPVGGLDEPARRGLRRLQRRGWPLVLGGLAIVATLIVLVVESRVFAPGDTHVDATVVETSTGVFDHVTVVYRVDGQRYRSVIHLADAEEYCRPSEYDTDPDCVDTRPVVAIDRADPGHATVPGEVNLSPVAMAAYATTFVLSLVAVPFMLFFGVSALMRTRRYRQILAEQSWMRHRARGRSPRTFEVSQDGERWRQLHIKRNVMQRGLSLRREEQLEIAAFVEGRAVVRAVGSEAMFDGVLEPLGRSPSAGIAHTAGIRSVRVGDGSLLSERAFVLVGSELSYDVLDLDGWLLGSLSGSSGFGTRCTLRDQSHRVLLSFRSTLGAWSARDGDGQTMVTARHRKAADKVTLEPGPGCRIALPAVRATRHHLRFEERVALATGELAPASGYCWRLLTEEDAEIARVTKVGTHLAVEIFVKADPANALVVLAETMLLAALSVDKPKSQGGG